ncbi:MAG: hypothetical protein HUU21_21970, partial [Polyangiaceae bacterium]|nr:hypothetical protein [Polyangiaceae bacterium]
GGAGGMGGAGGQNPAAECGNQIIEAPEQCDDGNTADGDYCAADCGSVTGECGDTIVQSNEACDDGNAAADDYCAADCGSVTGECGDGTLQANETCDDGIIKTDCNTFHDGGDGQCVAPGSCSPNYVLIMGQCKPALITDHVHIMPDNFCNITTNPIEYFVPAGQKLKIAWHNHSADIPVDVWMHYGGGFLDLQPGAIWNEQYEHCFGPAPSENYAEITACNTTIVFPIHCL